MSDLEALETGFVWGLSRLRAPLPTALRMDAATHKRVSDALAQHHARPSTGDKQADELPVALGAVAVPAGLQHIHPSWVRHALSRERLPVAAHLVQLLREAGVGNIAGPWDDCPPTALRPHVQTELIRWLFQPLADPEPVPTSILDHARAATDSGPGLARVVLWQRLPAVVLWRALCERGAAEVGRSLFRAEPVMRARAMATVGAPWAQVIARFAVGPVDISERDRARLAMARASVMAANAEVARDADLPETELRLAFVGLCAANNEIATAGHTAVRTIALRLPRVVGRWLWAGPPHAC